MTPTKLLIGQILVVLAIIRDRPIVTAVAGP